jgi:NADH-quinone oxidoreductase subunit G
MLSNKTSAAIDSGANAGTPVTAAIYQLDSVVRRAPSLQLTADARATQAAKEGVPA